MSENNFIKRQCDRRAQQPKNNHDQIPSVVKALSEGFLTKNWTSHIDPVAIPSRKEIVNLVRLTQQIIFPGYFNNYTPEILSPDNLEYYLGQKITILNESLAKQISSAIRHDCFRHDKACTKCRENSYDRASQFIKALPELKNLLEADISATLEGDPAAANADEVVFCYPGLFAIFIYRIAHKLIELDVPIIPRIMSQYAYSRTAIDINPNAEIGHSFFIDHGAGVVVGA
ncbi:MAG: serine acetyltransferase, partial [Desulfobulbaceae bacterium]|nr:serine acetyltransferase [Desulfobulbaceae bacterium]